MSAVAIASVYIPDLIADWSTRGAETPITEIRAEERGAAPGLEPDQPDSVKAAETAPESGRSANGAAPPEAVANQDTLSREIPVVAALLARAEAELAKTIPGGAGTSTVATEPSQAAAGSGEWAVSVVASPFARAIPWTIPAALAKSGQEPAQRQVMTADTSKPPAATAPAAAPGTTPTAVLAGGETLSAALSPVASETKHHEPRLPPAETEALITRGDELFAAGDVNSARLYYEYGAVAGNGAAALRLGGTFDPAFLAHARVGHVRGDLGKALYWYRRARDLGNADAEVLLRMLEKTGR